MFGLNDTTTQSNDDPAMLDNVKQLAQEPATAVAPMQPMPATPMQQQMGTTSTPQLQGFTMDPPTPAQTASQAVPVTTSYSTTSTSPLPDIQSVSSSASATGASFAQKETSETESASEEAPSTTTPGDALSSLSTPNPDHLANLKSEALSHLEPLTEHLGGTPEEVFKTTMMMIQANDNHTLLEKALEAAKKIADDKERAQAMLDIINEINYFAQTSQK
jgi:hypothetical protein